MTDNWNPGRTARPLVLVDIDGVLNPKKNQAERGFTPYRLKGEDELVWLSREHGRMLNELDREGLVELRWGTTWNEAANRTVAPRIGLDRPWEVVPIDRAQAGPVRFGFNWKAVSIQAGAEGQPFAWLDDFMTEADKKWAEDRVLDRGVPTLLLRSIPMPACSPSTSTRSGTGPRPRPDQSRSPPPTSSAVRRIWLRTRRRRSAPNGSPGRSARCRTPPHVVTVH